MMVLPMIRLGLSFSAMALVRAARIWSGLLPSMVVTRQPQASYFLAVSSCVTALVSVESWMSLES